MATFFLKTCLNECVICDDSWETCYKDKFVMIHGKKACFKTLKRLETCFFHMNHRLYAQVS